MRYKFLVGIIFIFLFFFLQTHSGFKQPVLALYSNTPTPLQGGPGDQNCGDFFDLYGCPYSFCPAGQQCPPTAIRYCQWAHDASNCMGCGACGNKGYPCSPCDSNGYCLGIGRQTKCDNTGFCGWFQYQGQQGHCVDASTPTPFPTDTPAPTPYYVIQSFNSNLQRVTVSQLCKVNCNYGSPPYCRTVSCDYNGSGSTFAGTNTNQGVALNDPNYVILGITPYLNKSVRTGTSSPDCRGSAGPVNCYYWNLSLSTGYLEADYIIASPTPTTLPTPTLYPTTAVSGPLQYQTASGICPAVSYPASGPVPTIILNPSSPQGVTSTCTANVPAASYQCNISYDNRTYPSIPLSQSFGLNSRADIYGTGNWTGTQGQANVNLCTSPANNNRTFAAGDVSSSNTIFFALSPWMKLQDGSLQTSGISFSIPSQVSKFDSSDNGNRYLIDGQAGVAATSGSSFPSASLVPISSSNYSTTSHNQNIRLNASGFLSYVRSRKNYTTLTSAPSDLSTLTSDGIYYYNTGGTPLTISKAPTNKIVLIIDGDVIIGVNLLQTQGFALLVNGNLSVNSALSEIHGIFSANSFDTGTATSGLKIVGNVQATTFNQNRSQNDNRYPSVFIDWNEQYYFDLLPNLSIRKYDWRQLQ